MRSLLISPSSTGRADTETSCANASTEEKTMEGRPSPGISMETTVDRCYLLARQSCGETPTVQAAHLPCPRLQISQGRETKSDVHVLGTRQGTFTARTIRRHPPSERHDFQLLLAMRGTPWSMTTGRYDDKPDERPEQPAAEEAAPASPSNESQNPVADERQEEQSR